MKLIKLYNKKSEFKHKNIFWWMTDLDNNKLLDWLIYCQKRHNDCHKPIILSPFIMYNQRAITLSTDHNVTSYSNRITFT